MLWKIADWWRFFAGEPFTRESEVCIRQILKLKRWRASVRQVQRVAR